MHGKKAHFGLSFGGSLYMWQANWQVNGEKVAVCGRLGRLWKVYLHPSLIGAFGVR